MGAAKLGSWGSLWRNEWGKIWAQRGKTLVVAWLVIVVAGTLLAWNGNRQMAQSATANLQATKQAVSQLSQQIAQASGKQKAQLEQELAGARQQLAQISRYGNATNVAQQRAATEASLKNTPLSQQGPLLQTIAQDQAMLAHGITEDNPNLNTGLGLVGDLFSTTAMILFGIVAVGLAADRISGESESGTLGVLLLHAPKRRSVYTAKLVATLSWSWAFMTATALGCLGLGSLVLGWGHFLSPVPIGVHWVKAAQGYMMMMPQTFHFMAQGGFDVLAWLLAGFSVAIMVLITQALSVLTRSTVVTIIVGALLVFSTELAILLVRIAPALALADPAVHLPLMGDWTGQRAASLAIVHLTLGVGILDLVIWGVVALGVGVWSMRRLDV